ncbi:MAG: tetratricopeptide repeat protein [Sphingobacteriaceae bacterium]
MKRLIKFLIIAFYPVLIFAQINRNTFDIEFPEKAQLDTVTINRYTLLANRYLNLFPDSAFYYSNKALTESIKLKYILGVAEAKIILAKFYHINRNDLNKSLYYFKNSLKLLYYLDSNLYFKDSAYFKAKLAEALNGIGLCEQKLGHPIEALNYIHKAFNIGMLINNDLIVSKSFHNMALVYNDIGDFNQALDYAYKAIEIRTKTNNQVSNAYTYNLIGNIYGKINDKKNALKYNLFSHKLLQGDSLADKRLLAANTINLAIIYAIYNNKIIAESYFNEAHELIFKYKIFSALPGYYTQRAAFYEEYGDLTKAIEYNLLALNTAGGNQREVSNAHLNLGSIYYKTGKYNTALKHALNSLNISRKINSDIGRIIRQQKLVIKIYEKLKNFKIALIYSKDLTKQLDSLAASSTSINLNKTKKLFDFEKSIILEKEKEKITQIELNQKIKRQEIIRNSIVVFAILTIVILVLAVITYKNKVKSKQQMMEKLEEIYKQSTQSLIQEQKLIRLQSILNGQEGERKRIAEELHDGVGGSLAGIKLKLSALADNNLIRFTTIENIIENIDSVYKEIRNISHNLIPPYLNDNSFTVSIDNLIENIRSNTSIKITIDYLKKEKLNSINKELKVALFRIMQELLKNAVSHAKCDLIEITINQYEDEIIIIFEDNGIGFDTGVKKQGIGLRNIQSRVNALNGNLTIDSKLNRGSAFHILIKI